MSDEPTFDPRRKAAIRELVVDNAAAHPGRAGGRKRTALVATLVVLALTISGGSVAYALGTGLFDPAPVAPTTSPTPTVTPTPTPTSTPTPTPTPTAAAPDPADPSTWTIDFNGVGPFRLSMPIVSVPSAASGFADETDERCKPRQVDLVASDHLGISAFSPQQQPDTVDSLLLNYNFTIYGDPAPVTPRTDRGIGIGSTTEELLAAYPGIALTGTYNEVADNYGLQDSAGTWIVFRTLHDRVDVIMVSPVSVIPSEFCPA
ncbi:hypothetical protein ACF1AJ_16215 [Leifsonia sp. NPDC014704]|uniref:hypothetical protein n=1 Tax=Leifsonia sp. NPDC014704 TaxID=3364123 RepID=UPI0036F49EBC